MTWLNGDKMRHFSHFLVSFSFATAASIAANQFAPSSYMCIPSIDNPSLVSYSRTGMLLLDIAIAILSWQQLSWGKNMQDRTQTIAKVLALSAFCTFMFDNLRSLWGSPQPNSGDIPFHYSYDIFIDGMALSVLLIFASLWICDTNLTAPVGISASIAGVWQASVNAGRYAEWDYLLRAPVLLPLFVVTVATISFTYSQHLRTVVQIPRGMFNWLVFLVALLATLHALLASTPLYDLRHPINQLLYDSEISYRHWVVKASTSSTFSTAVRIYEDRHNGRKAPPQYKEWYAQLRRSKIRDNFPQIDEDLEPFWHLTPKQLREAVEEASRLPGVATLVIKNGEATIGRNDAGGSGTEALTRLVHMANNFSSHLPDMTLPINLARSPRILPSWENRWTYSRASEDAASADVISGRSVRQAEMSATHEAPSEQQVTLEERGIPTPGNKNAMTAGEFRAMLRQACPPNSASRANPYWNTAGFCRRCAKGHSTLQLMSDWQQSLESLCSQPDLKNLHGFYMTAPDVRPVQKLLPLFSLSKTDHFADILLPLWPEEAAPAEAGKVVPDKPFLDRSDNISWSGSIGQNSITPEYLRGHHKLRLLGQLTRPRPTDKTTLIKPILVDETRTWLYAKRPTAAVNSKLPLSVGISDYTACTGHNCDVVKQLFDDDHHRQAASGDSASLQVDESKIVLLLDEDDGPARGTLQALRTETMPVISTIFKTWYTSRLRAWVHFVPLDVRYHALHTTLSYFSVLEDRRASGVMDSKGIAQQGKSWVKEALRERDQELYLSRLLMEWARLIDDKRDEMGVSTAAAPVKHNPNR